jgi:hypothetical protein
MESTKEYESMTENEIKLMMGLVEDFVKKFFSYTKNIPDLTTIQIHENLAVVTFLDKGQLKCAVIKIEEEI